MGDNPFDTDGEDSNNPFSQVNVHHLNHSVLKIIFRKVRKERGVKVLVVETPLEMIMRRKRLIPIQ